MCMCIFKRCNAHMQYIHTYICIERGVYIYIDVSVWVSVHMCTHTQLQYEALRTSTAFAAGTSSSRSC